MTATPPPPGRPVRLLGYLAYIGLLTAGYYYNLTFVQLGIIDLGTRGVGLDRGQVSVAMGGLALTAFLVAVATGMLMDRLRWNVDLPLKLRIVFGVVALQTVLTLVAPSVGSRPSFVVWVLGCAIVIGVGIPVTFGLMRDFIPVHHRGHVAAVVAGLAFFAAALYPREWRMGEFAAVLSTAMIPATIVLGVIAFGRFAIVSELGRLHELHGPGRFRRPGPERATPAMFWGLVVLMFAVFFIDSLGFLRIIEAPAYISTSWQSPDTSVRLFIGISHLVGAVMAGVLYTAFGRRWLIVWVLGLFAFTHLLYTSHLSSAPSGMDPPLVLPLFYVLAVSFYTTLNFALWPDLSTAADIGTRTALGVGIAGWLASFLSTALALYSENAEVSLLAHLRYVNALALLLAVGVPVVFYVNRMRSLARSPA
ncbi:MAG TPA: MFS transporter [Acidimicrobiia bacterium]|nr:MFS transporter [Acidimicrobiia bacterium]